MNPYRYQYSKMHGFTMIEVLITVVILSIGLLGMAGIQIQGLRGTTSSSARGQATVLANDIAERIRLNNSGIFIPGADENEQYSNVNIVTNADSSTNISCDPNGYTICSATSDNPNAVASCDISQMTQFDIFEFACGLNGNAGITHLLPMGSASITCDTENCPPGSEVTINVGWSEANDENGNPQTKNITMVIIP